MQTFARQAVRYVAGFWSRILSRGVSGSSVKPSYWTIQVLPEGSGSSHSYRVRKRTAYVAVAGVVGLFGMSAAFFLGMLGRGDALDEASRYRAENEQLIATLGVMEDRSQRLGRALDDLSEREQRFRVVAGLPLIDAEIYSVGVGGPGGLAETDGLVDVAPDLAKTAGDVVLDLDELVRRADLLSASLVESVESVETQRDQFRRTPAIWPVIAEDSWISSGFSYNRMHPLLGYRRPHPGVDISADYGSAVVATGAGRVTFAGPKSGYGRIVEIDHGDGYETRYAHLASTSVRTGNVVDRGDVLGEVGRSGLATGPNLHYEVIRDGRPQNPWDYLLDGQQRR